MNKVTIFLLAALVAACGCDERSRAWERERNVLGPLELEKQVVYVDSARDVLISVEATTDTPRISAFPIGRNAAFLVPTPDRKQVAVLTRGEEPRFEGDADEPPAVWLVDVRSPGTEPTGYPVGSPFDRLAMSHDNRFAVAYHSGGGFDPVTGIFRNPNELAIVDLAAPPSEANPTLRTVRSFGSAPDGIVLSPPITLAGDPSGEERVFAVVLAPQSLTIVDVAHPTNRELSIRFDQGSETITPRELVFAPNSATIYVRSDNAGDVLAVQLEYQAPRAGDVDDNSFAAQLAELGAGAGPADIAVYDDPSGHRFVLAAIPALREVVVIDADTAEFMPIDTAEPVDRIELFGDTALLASMATRPDRIEALKLGNIGDDLAPIDLQTLAIGAPLVDLVPIPATGQAMLVHDSQRTVLGMLDIDVGSVAPLQGIGRLAAFDISVEGNFLVGITDQSDRVGVIDLVSLHPSDVRLDHPPRHVFALGNGAVFIDHGDPAGLATILPRAGARRSDALVLRGFLFADLLNQRL